jgi:hypothetical protein
MWIVADRLQTQRLPHRIAIVQTFMLFQFVIRKVNLGSCLFAGGPRVSVFLGVRFQEDSHAFVGSLNRLLQ